MKLPRIFELQIQRAFNAGYKYGWNKGVEKGFEYGVKSERAKHNEHKGCIISGTPRKTSLAEQQIEQIFNEKGV